MLLLLNWSALQIELQTQRNRNLTFTIILLPINLSVNSIPTQCRLYHPLISEKTKPKNTPALPQYSDERKTLNVLTSEYLNLSINLQSIAILRTGFLLSNVLSKCFKLTHHPSILTYPQTHPTSKLILINSKTMLHQYLFYLTANNVTPVFILFNSKQCYTSIYFI